MDFYRLLGVERDASVEQIRAAWKKLAKELHPDRNPDADAELRFIEAKKASVVLLDPLRRREYDRAVQAPAAAPAPAPGRSSHKRFDAVGGLQDLEAREREAAKRRRGAAHPAATRPPLQPDIIVDDDDDNDDSLDSEIARHAPSDPRAAMSFDDYEAYVLNRIQQLFSPQ